LDPRDPAQGYPVQAQPVLDQRAGAHLQRLGGEQAEPEPRRRDPLEVPGAGKEPEYLVDRPGHELLAVQMVGPWVVVKHLVHYYLYTMTSALVDTLLDRTIALGYGTVGLKARRRLPDWPADPPRMDGKAVLVTGAASGLGLASAIGFARLGATVHALARTHQRAGEAAGRI